METFMAIVEFINANTVLVFAGTFSITFLALAFHDRFLR